MIKIIWYLSHLKLTLIDFWLIVDFFLIFHPNKWLHNEYFIYFLVFLSKKGFLSLFLNKFLYKETKICKFVFVHLFGIYKSSPRRSISASIKSTSPSVTAAAEMIERKKFGRRSSGWYPTINVPACIIRALMIGQI